MIDCQFHETKSERKFYEDKKQKALRYLDHTMNILHDLERIKELVNDI